MLPGLLVRNRVANDYKSDIKKLGSGLWKPESVKLTLLIMSLRLFGIFFSRPSALYFASRALMCSSTSLLVSRRVPALRI